MAEAIQIGIELDSSGVEKGFSKLSTAAVAVGAAITAAIVVGLNKSIEAAIEAEDAVNKLNTAMKLTGTFSQEASDSFQKFSASLQKTTGVSDDLINRSAALLVSMGKLSGEGLQNATKAAIDMSKALGIDTESAFAMLAKAANGSMGALSRYGIKVDETIPKAERFNAVVDQLNNRFGGAAAAQMNTYSGALNNLSLNIGDIFEEIGKFFTNSDALKKTITYIANALGTVSESIAAFGKTNNPVDAVVKSLISVGLAITNYVMPPFELLWNASKVIFFGIRGFLQDIVVLIATVADGYGKIGNAVGLVSDETANGINQFLQSSKATLDSFAKEEQASIAGLFSFDASLAASNFAEGLQQVVTTTAPVLDGLKNQTKTAFKEISDEAKKTAEQIGMAWKNGLVSTISGGIQKIVTNLVQGKNIFKDFGKTILGLLGDMAIQIGTIILGTGIAYKSLGDFTGTSPIIYGAALIALGAALKAFAGSGESSSATGSGGGGGNTGGGGFTEPDNITELEPQKPQTNISVNIQGNVLDRRQTGLEIAEVIQETFGSNGLNFTTA